VQHLQPAELLPYHLLGLYGLALAARVEVEVLQFHQDSCHYLGVEGLALEERPVEVAAAVTVKGSENLTEL
jgi:hypothetical protein